MNNIFKKINNAKLTESEKQTGFNRLQVFIRNNPENGPVTKNFTEKILSPFHDGLFLHHKILAATFAFIIIIGATGSTSVVANKSVPGDALYAFKINLNEKVETLTAISPESKANIEAKHVNERLMEAEQLTAVNKLDDGLRAKIEQQFVSDLQNTMIHVDTLNTNGGSNQAKQVKANIEKTLQKHKDIVGKILDNKKRSKTSTTPAEPAVMMMSAKIIEDTASSTQTTSTTTEVRETNRVRKMTESKNELSEDTPLLNETLNKISREKESERED